MFLYIVVIGSVAAVINSRGNEVRVSDTLLFKPYGVKDNPQFSSAPPIVCSGSLLGGCPPPPQWALGEVPSDIVGSVSKSLFIHGGCIILML